MQKTQKHIEIARTNLPGFSSLGKTSAEGIRKYLSSVYTNVQIVNIDSQSDLEKLVIRCPDLVFMGMDILPRTYPINAHNKEIIWLTSYLASKGIEHTGSTRGAIKLERNKPQAKDVVKEAGLETAKYFVLEKDEPYSGKLNGLEYPVFVKPSGLGAGVGIDDRSIVRTEHDFRAKVAALRLERDTDILVEQYLPGREFSVAILQDNAANRLVAMPIEIVPKANKNGDRILGVIAKGENKEVVSFVSDMSLRQELCNLAIGAFKAIGGRDYGRIDIRLDSRDVPQFLEANLIPSLLRDYGNFPKASKINRGLEYEEVIQTIVDLAFARNKFEVQHNEAHKKADVLFV